MPCRPAQRFPQRFVALTDPGRLLPTVGGRCHPAAHQPAAPPPPTPRSAERRLNTVRRGQGREPPALPSAPPHRLLPLPAPAVPSLHAGRQQARQLGRRRKPREAVPEQHHLVPTKPPVQAHSPVPPPPPPPPPLQALQQQRRTQPAAPRPGRRGPAHPPEREVPGPLPSLVGPPPPLPLLCPNPTAKLVFHLQNKAQPGGGGRDSKGGREHGTAPPGTPRRTSSSPPQLHSSQPLAAGLSSQLRTLATSSLRSSPTWHLVPLPPHTKPPQPLHAD